MVVRKNPRVTLPINLPKGAPAVAGLSHEAHRPITAMEDEVDDIELESDVTERVLEGTPERVVKFILAANASRGILSRLQVRGYTLDVVKEALRRRARPRRIC